MRFIKRRDGDWVHPSKLVKDDVEQWLSSMANDRRVSASTQNQALQSVCFLYRNVLRQPIEGVNALRAKPRKYTKSVIAPSQVYDVLRNMKGIPQLVCALQYATGMRPGEALSIRLKDFNFEREQITVRGGKGKKDRIVPFPKSIHGAVRKQMEVAKQFHGRDIANGNPGVSLPEGAGHIKSAHFDLGWYYLFCSKRLSQCPETGRTFRHHADGSNVSRALKIGKQKAKILERVTPHCLRSYFATHALERGVDIKTIQSWLGHESIETTEIYLHVRKERFVGLSPGETTEMLSLFSAA